jgi:cytoskeletal protein RodZ
MRIHTTHTRDAALRDLNRITRWLIAASLVLTGILSDVAASAFGGKAAKHGAPKKAPAAGGANQTSTSTTPLSPPAQTPTTPSESSTQSAPSSEQPAPSQEPAPEAAHESAPAQEREPAHEAAPEATHEAAPEAPREAAPEAPVVSGGS